MEKTYEVYDYDVWGNEKDGFEVNDCIATGEMVTLKEDATDKQIVAALKKQGIIQKGIHTKSVTIDGEMDYTLYFDYKGRPEFELRAR